ncbi:MAG TPA: Asp23/Gls24 family envelope stress response protein [Streptosporangiaceae bacterium]|jgi:uncharacterized alkaline shock family protein YloU
MPKPSTTYDIRESVVAAIAVHAATQVPGVLRMEPGLSGLVTSVTRSLRQRLAGVDPAPAEGARAEIDDGKVWLDVAVAVGRQDQAAAVGQAVQRAVAQAVRDATGYPVGEVAVSILHIDPGPDPADPASWTNQ